MKRSEALIVFLLGAACYLNTLSNGFVWDDHSTVEQNAFIHEARNARDILRPSFLWRPNWKIENQARPVWILSAMLDWRLWGGRAWGHHLTNILLHAANGALFYALLSAAGAPGQAALWASALFAVHPVHAEAVAPVSYREDLLAVFFCLLAALALLRRRALGTLASLAAFFLALMSKEMAVTFPGAVFLFDSLVLSRSRAALAPRRLALYLPFALILGHYLWFHSVRFNYKDLTLTASVAPPSVASAAPPAAKVSPVYTKAPAKASAALLIFSAYVRQMLLPWNLCADYKIPVPKGFDPAVLASAAVLIAALTLAAWGCFHSPWLGFGLLWFFLSLLPVSNLIPILNLRADRYLYMPSLGFCLAAAALLNAAAARWKRPAAAALALILALCAFRTIARNRDWRDDMSIFADTSRCCPDNSRAHYNYGVLLQERGRLPEAIREYQAAAALNPGFVAAHLNLGLCHENLGDRNQAKKEYIAGLAADPAFLPLLSNLARLYAIENNCQAAIPLYERMLSLSPQDPVARNNLVVCRTRVSHP